MQRIEMNQFGSINYIDVWHNIIDLSCISTKKVIIELPMSTQCLTPYRRRLIALIRKKGNKKLFSTFVLKPPQKVSCDIFLGYGGNFCSGNDRSHTFPPSHKIWVASNSAPAYSLTLPTFTTTTTPTLRKSLKLV